MVGVVLCTPVEFLEESSVPAVYQPQWNNYVPDGMWLVNCSTVDPYALADSVR